MEVLLEEHNWAGVTRRLCHLLSIDCSLQPRAWWGREETDKGYVLSTWTALTEGPMLCGLTNRCLCPTALGPGKVQDPGDGRFGI